MTSFLAQIRGSSMPWREALRLAVPSAVTQLARYGSTLAMVIFSARYLDKESFAGVALGMSISNIALLTYLVAVAMVLDTLTTTEFGRDRHSARLGKQLRLAFGFVLVYLVPAVVLMMLFSKAILSKVLSDDIASSASTMLLYTALYTTPLGCFFCVQKWLAAQRIVSPPVVAQSFGVVVLVLLLFLTRHYGSIAQVALCLAAARTAALTTLVVVALKQHPDLACRLREGFGEPNLYLSPLRQVPIGDDVRGFARALGHSYLICAAERWSFEVVMLLAATLGATAVDAFQIGIGCPGLFFAFAVGGYVAGNTATGNALGSGDADLARRSALAAIVIAAIPSVVISTTTALFPQLYVALFAPDAAVAAAAESVTRILALASIFDNVGYVLQGVLRACDEMAFLSRVISGGHWLLNVPGAYLVLRFTSMGIQGLACCALLALFFVFATSLWKFANLDWHAAALRTCAAKPGVEALGKDEDSAEGCPVEEGTTMMDPEGEHSEREMAAESV